MILFTCPVCGKPLRREEKSLYCEDRHTYDVARSGYVHLLKVNEKNSVAPGDNKDMIAARARVMEKGYYKPLSDYVIGKMLGRERRAFLDAGCGTGYLAGALKTAFSETEVYGTDISKPAIEKASKLYKGVSFAVASSKNLPLASEVFDLVTCAFAPVYAEEFGRVLKRSGVFMRVAPAKEHLFDLKKYLYDAPRKNEEDETSYDGFDLIDTEIVEGTFTGDRDDVKALVKMTPYYYHTSEDVLKKLDAVDRLTTVTAFEVRTYARS